MILMRLQLLNWCAFLQPMRLSAFRVSVKPIDSIRNTWDCC